MKYFTYKELTKSATAQRRGIDNTPNGIVKANLTALVANVLDPLREAWGEPIIVTSGYRSVRLNRAVGGASKSQHTEGKAADIRTVSDRPSDNLRLLKLIVSLHLPFDQVIFEYGGDSGPDWIHVSYDQGRNRRQVLRATRKDGKTIYSIYKP